MRRRRKTKTMVMKIILNIVNTDVDAELKSRVYAVILAIKAAQRYKHDFSGWKSTLDSWAVSDRLSSAGSPESGEARRVRAIKAVTEQLYRRTVFALLQLSSFASAPLRTAPLSPSRERARTRLHSHALLVPVVLREEGDPPPLLLLRPRSFWGFPRFCFCSCERSSA
ncbi:hypothetical protein MHYP_G00182460 [Metynnis hypsauchen]